MLNDDGIAGFTGFVFNPGSVCFSKTVSSVASSKESHTPRGRAQQCHQPTLHHHVTVGPQSLRKT